MSLVAINLGYVIAGAITVEIVFNWPGLGTLIVEASGRRDYPVLQGIFLLLSVTVVLANLIADLAYGVPRPEGPDVTAPVMPIAMEAPLRPPSRFGHGRELIRQPSGLIGVVILVVFGVLAVVPDLLVGPLQTAVTATGPRLQPPNGEYPLGTDELGRSMLNLVVHATRISMVIGLLATIITVAVGAVLGIVSGYIGGRFDSLTMRVADFFLVLPTFVLAIILTAIIRDVLGTGSKEVAGIRLSLLVIVVVIGITSWSSTARIIRAQTLSLRERAFVDRARVIGASAPHIMRRHILPNVMNLIIANAVLTFAGAILTETTLSFVGLGDPFQPSWGQLLDASQSVGAPTLGAWWYFVPAGSAVVLVVFAFTLLGRALDEITNPRRPRAHVTAGRWPARGSPSRRPLPSGPRAGWPAGGNGCSRRRPTRMRRSSRSST